MQINFFTYPRIYYTLGRWLGMVVYIMLEIFRAGPPYKLAGLQPNCNFNFFFGVFSIPGAYRLRSYPFTLQAPVPNRQEFFNLVTPYIL